MSQPITNAVPEAGASQKEELGWGVIVAIVSIALLALGALALAFFCCVCRSRRVRLFTSNRSKNTTNSSLSFSRRLGRSPGPTADYTRASTRSTNPLRNSNRGPRCHVVPLSQKHNPGKFTFYWDKEKENWKLCEDAVPPFANTSCLRSTLSPIDEMETPLSGEFQDVSNQYNIQPQAPFSPYHLTWITPQAPPPSYEESDISSTAKHLYSELTATTQSEDTCSGCQMLVKGKSVDSIYNPNNNTPETEFEFSSHGRCQLKDLMISQADYNNNNTSQYTSYPSTRCSSEPHINTSSLETMNDSIVKLYDSSIGYPKHTSESQNTAAHSSRAESEMPSLPSSILYYHQRMTNNNVVQGSKMPKFSPHAYNLSMTGSIQSPDTHYEDNTSMLANVGSSNTSGNPTMSLQHGSLQEPHGSMSLQHGSMSLQQVRHSVNEDDLSKMVDELSSIRANSNEPGSINHGIVTSLAQIDNNIGQSYVNDVFHGSEFEAKLFRSWSVTAELDYSSLSSRATTSLNAPNQQTSSVTDGSLMKRQDLEESLITDLNQNHIPEKGNPDESIIDNTSCVVRSDKFPKVSNIDNVNLNSVDINKIPFPGRKVTFDVPILVNKTYWV